MNVFKKVNFFTILLVVLSFGMTLRLFDLKSFPAPVSVAESAAPQETPKADAALPEGEDGAEPPAAEALKDANAPPAPPPSYGEHAFSASEVDVLQSLAKRRDELDLREQQMEKRNALLKAAEGEVERKITELDKIKSELVALLNKQKTIEDERISSLVKIYEGMKPKDAARIFDTLEMEILLPVMGKMSERKSSPILASMTPDKARQLTIRLAEQHKLPDAAGDTKDVKVKPAEAALPSTPAPAPSPPP